MEIIYKNIFMLRTLWGV